MWLSAQFSMTLLALLLCFKVSALATDAADVVEDIRLAPLIFGISIGAEGVNSSTWYEELPVPVSSLQVNRGSIRLPKSATLIIGWPWAWACFLLPLILGFDIFISVC